MTTDRGCLDVVLSIFGSSINIREHVCDSLLTFTVTVSMCTARFEIGTW